jgi:hypothetical protein
MYKPEDIERIRLKWLSVIDKIDVPEDKKNWLALYCEVHKNAEQQINDGTYKFGEALQVFSQTIPNKDWSNTKGEDMVKKLKGEK